jgi:ubiquinol-cytochrome c reductase cytochrome b subunit
MRYRPVARQFYFGFVIVCVLLGWCGAKAPDAAVIPALQGEKILVVNYSENGQESTSEYKGEDAYVDAKRFMANLPEGASPSLVAVAPATFQFSQLSLILTICYFGYFFMLFFIGLTEKPKELPESIHKSVLKRHKASSATAVPAE